MKIFATSVILLALLAMGFCGEKDNKLEEKEERDHEGGKEHKKMNETDDSGEETFIVEKKSEKDPEDGHEHEEEHDDDHFDDSALNGTEGNSTEEELAIPELRGLCADIDGKFNSLTKPAQAAATDIKSIIIRKTKPAGDPKEAIMNIVNEQTASVKNELEASLSISRALASPAYSPPGSPPPAPSGAPAGNSPLPASSGAPSGGPLPSPPPSTSRPAVRR